MQNKASSAVVAGFAAAALILLNGCKVEKPDVQASQDYATHALAEAHAARPPRLRTHSEAGATYMYWAHAAKDFDVCTNWPPRRDGKLMAANVIGENVLTAITRLPRTNVDPLATSTLEKLTGIYQTQNAIWANATGTAAGNTASDVATAPAGDAGLAGAGSAIGNAIGQSATAYQNSRQLRTDIDQQLERTRRELSVAYGRKFPAIAIGKSSCLSM